jgi:hypothetical protein
VLTECAAVYENNPHITEELQQEISAAVIRGSEETPPATERNSGLRRQTVLGAMRDKLKLFLRGFQSSKTTELRDTKFCPLLCG